MIQPERVSACLVTRGDVDLTEIIDSITAAGIADIVVWDNAKRSHDYSCYGRYAAVAEAENEYIYQQDDDLVAPVAEILAQYDPETDRDAIVCNNRADEEWLLIGMGCVFHRDLATCFQPYVRLYGFDADFCRVSDVVFAYSNRYRRVTLGYRNLPWGFATPENPRMYGESDHMLVRERARRRTLTLAWGHFAPSIAKMLASAWSISVSMRGCWRSYASKVAASLKREHPSATT